MEKGYSDTAISDIADAANVSFRLVTTHFGSKDEIYIEVLDRHFGNGLSKTPRTGSTDSAEDAVFIIAKAIVDRVFSPSSINLHRLLIADGDRLHSERQRISQSAAAKFHADVAESLSKLSRRGLLQIDDAAKAARYLVDMLSGLSVSRVSVCGPDFVPDDDEIRDKVRMFCRGWLA